MLRRLLKIGIIGLILVILVQFVLIPYLDKKNEIINVYEIKNNLI